MPHHSFDYYSEIPKSDSSSNREQKRVEREDSGNQPLLRDNGAWNSSSSNSRQGSNYIILLFRQVQQKLISQKHISEFRIPPISLHQSAQF